MKKFNKDSRIIKPRNPAIIKAFKREIDLKTKVVQDKSKYDRKIKHKNNINM